MGLFKLEQDVRDVMETMFRNHLTQCGYNPAVASIPPMTVSFNVEYLGHCEFCHLILWTYCVDIVSFTIEYFGYSEFCYVQKLSYI